MPYLVFNQELRTHSQGSGVRVEDVDPELLQCFLEDDVHHGVLFTILRIQVRYLQKMFTFITKLKSESEQRELMKR